MTENAIDQDLSDLHNFEDQESENEFPKPVRKRRGRKKSLKVTEEKLSFFDEKALGYLINFPFDYLARIKENPSLKLNEEEKTTLTTLANKVITKRMPEFLQKFSDEIALGIAMTSIIIPRIILIRESNKKEKDNEK